MSFSTGEAPEIQLRVVLDVLTEARQVDTTDPIDEAAARHLALHGLQGTQVWLTGHDGFALRRGTEVDLVVRPGQRGAGRGTALAQAALTAPGPVSAWSHGDDPSARAIAARFDLRADRSLWVMRLDLGAAPPPSLVVPRDVRIRAFEPDSSDADDVVRVNAAAFAHHPEQGSMDAAELAERMSEPWFDPAGLLLAVASQTEQVLGFHWTKRHDVTLGEVYVVGIDPSAQGRGLGRVLTLAGLHHLATGGSTEVLLYVESDNAPALAVYTGLGFTHSVTDTHVQYRRD